MATDDSFQQAGVAEMVETRVLGVPLSTGPHERQVSWCGVVNESLLERGKYLLSDSVTPISRTHDHVSIVYHGDGLACTNNFADSHDRLPVRTYILITPRVMIRGPDESLLGPSSIPL